MTAAIKVTVQDNVAVVPLEGPALSVDLRQRVMDAIDRSEEDEQVDAILLLRAAEDAPLGIPASDAGAGSQDPSLADLCARIDYCDTPVIAAFDGEILGAGLEMALAARFRVAGPTLKVSAPELRFGVSPGAGLTQRLPRLVGAARSLQLVLRGHSVTARDPILEGVFDTIADGPLLQTALLFSKNMPPSRALVKDRRDGFQDMVAYQAAILEMRERLGETPRAAVLQVVDLIEAAPLLPFEAGLDMEQEAFVTSLASTEARALRHLTSAEARLTAAMATDGQRRQTVAILGANAVSVQVAAMLLNAGFTLRWGAVRPERLEAAFKALKDMPGMTPQRLASVVKGNMLEAVEGAGVVLLSTPGPLETEVLPTAAVIDLVPGPNAPLGLRFPMPLRGGRVVERLVRPGTDPELVRWFDTFIGQIGRIAVPVAAGKANLAQRMMRILHRATDALVDLGADPFAIDEALTGWGFARGPFLQRDILGLAGSAKAPRAKGAVNWSAELSQQGRAGRYAGKGFYDWDGEGRALANDAVRDIIAAKRAETGRFTQSDLLRLVLGALTNEAARYLQDSVIAPGDLDVLLSDAFKIDRLRGGLLFAAGEAGMLSLMRALNGIEHPDTALWTPEPLWQERIKNGQSFLTE